mgnify:CR=1 FL=1
MDYKKPAAVRGKKRKTVCNDASKAANVAERREMEKLIQSLSRASLERMVVDSFLQNVPVNLDILERAQPPKPKPSAQKPQARVDTGAFDLVDNSVLQHILEFLPLQDRLVCASSVCKVWRLELRTQLPELWHDLTVFRPPGSDNKCCACCIS